MLDALFSTTVVPPSPLQDRAKRHRVIDEDESQEQKKVRNKLEVARKASLIDE